MVDTSDMKEALAKTPTDVAPELDSVEPESPNAKKEVVDYSKLDAQTANLFLDVVGRWFGKQPLSLDNLEKETEWLDDEKRVVITPADNKDGFRLKLDDPQPDFPGESSYLTFSYSKEKGIKIEGYAGSGDPMTVNPIKAHEFKNRVFQEVFTVFDRDGELLDHLFDIHSEIPGENGHIPRDQNKEIDFFGFLRYTAQRQLEQPESLMPLKAIRLPVA